jgi:hypothetical protein
MVTAGFEAAVVETAGVATATAGAAGVEPDDVDTGVLAALELSAA